MKRRFAFATFVLLTFIAISTFTLRATEQAGHSPIASPSPAGRQTVFSRLPLRFEANAGQTDPQVEFLARGPGYSLFLARSEAILSLSSPSRSPRPTAASWLPSKPSFVRSAVLRMTLVGAKKSPHAIGIDRLSGVSNYATGSDPSKWLTGVPSYARVRYKSVYPGIDVEYYGKQTQLEYDFVVDPGADPSFIRLAFHGADQLVLNEAGELVLEVDGAAVRQPRPLIYQEIDGARQSISGGYRMLGANEVGFEIGGYDATRPLVIDPVLTYSTYLGGSGSDGSGYTDIGVDGSNNVYVVGNTNSVDFPVSGDAAAIDVFVTKLNPAGDGIVYSTFLGGSNNDGDSALALAVDLTGNAYVTGGTNSTNFPATAGAHDTTCGSDGTCNGSGDAFVTKLNAAGAVAYSTYLGGADSDAGYAIAVNSLGEAFVSGGTADTVFDGGPSGFPLVGAYQSLRGSFYDSFVTRLSASGSTVLYSTILGGSDDDYAGLDIVANGSIAHVTGVSRSSNFPTTASAFDTACGASGTFDAFVAKLNTSLSGSSSLVYGTCLGGASGNESGNGITVDGSGRIHVTGNTSSSDFPVTSNAIQLSPGGMSDAFLTTIDPAQLAPAQVIYSTFLGGAGDDAANGLALDDQGALYVAGYTGSSDFPVVDYVQGSIGGGTCGVTPNTYPCLDAFVAKLFPDGSPLIYSTYLGGGGDDYAWEVSLDSQRTAHLVGFTSSADFPTVDPLQESIGGNGDAFVAKLLEDADSDGIADSVDACPAQGEDFDTIQDLDGCPETDADGDLIFDEVDEAPLSTSIRFSDRPLGGRTSGRIAALPAGMSIQIVDHPNPARGVRATVAGAAGQRVTLWLDGKSSSIQLRSPGIYTVTDPNTETTVGVEVGGPAELQIVVNGSTFVVEIGEGEEAKIIETDADSNGSVDSVDVEPIVGQITVNGAVVGPSGVTVSSLLSTKLAIQRRLRTFELATTLVASGPIDPRVEPVSIRVGGFATTIPPASFVLKRGVYSYAGTIAGVRLIASITPQRNGRYAVTVLGYGPNFTGVVNPVAVQITIGDDSGIQSVRATIW